MSFIEKIKKYFKDTKRKQNEIYWGLVFNNAIANSHWFLNQSVFPGRWAAGYPLLYILFRVYNDIKPKSILEFGLGESTKLLVQYKQHYADVQCTVIEQDQQWLNYFCDQVYDVRKYSKLVEIEKISKSGAETYFYKDIISHITGRKYDFILIDGPWGGDYNSRYQIVEMAENNLIADEFIIIIDDYNRNGEKQTAQILRELFVRKNINYEEGVYSGDKDTLVFCSKKYRMVISL